MASSIWARKSIADAEREVSHAGGLRRTLNKWHLTALGVGATIGAGIFATTGTAIVGDAARPGAGPAIVLSFILTAVACGFAALCYAEFAAMVPVSGSAYTYAYASLGEFVAWIIGWDLIVEYAVGNIGIILFFIAVGVFLLRPSNWTNPALGGFAPNGFAGISAGAAIIFFSYIGFDAVSTASEEAKDPGKDMPFGIIMSLVICTVLYVILSVVMTGMAPWNTLGTAEPMITALQFSGGPPALVNVSRLI